MSNSLLTNDIITRESLESLNNALVVCKKVTTEYSSEFAKKGMKNGATVNIRKPSRYEVTEGATLNIQDSKDQYVPLAVDKHYHVGMAFTEDDRTLSIDKFRERYIDPAMIALANKIDSALAIDMMRQTYHTVGVPSATALPSTLKGFTFAKAKIMANGGPKGIYNAVVDPLVEATMVDGLKGLFQSSEKIASQYETGEMGLAGGMRFMMSQNIPKHTIGALGGTPAIKTTVTTQGQSTIDLDGSLGTVTGYFKKGDVITIAGVYAVNPQSRQSTGELAQFVVTADTNSSGGEIATVQLDRGMYSSGQYQNVTALPIDGALVTVFGHASSYANVICPQNLVFHKSAYAMASVDFELPDAGVKATRAVDPDSGLALTMTSQFDITNYRTIHRIDWLGGWKAIYPDLAARVVGQPA